MAVPSGGVGPVVLLVMRTSQGLRVLISSSLTVGLVVVLRSCECFSSSAQWPLVFAVSSLSILGIGPLLLLLFFSCS